MGEFADYFKEKKNLFNLLVLGILVLALPLSINLIRQQQILKSRAAVDPIVFTGDNVQKKTDGTWIATKPQVTLLLYSPLGPAANTQTVQSKDTIMSKLSEGLIETVYAGETCSGGTKNVGDSWPECQGCDEGTVTCTGQDQYSWTSVRNPSPNCGSNCVTGGGGGVCTPGAYESNCTQNGVRCGGCNPDQGIQYFRQCNSAGTGWGNWQEQCSTACVGPCKINTPTPKPSGTPVPTGGGLTGPGGSCTPSGKTWCGCSLWSTYCEDKSRVCTENGKVGTICTQTCTACGNTNEGMTWGGSCAPGGTWDVCYVPDGGDCNAQACTLPTTLSDTCTKCVLSEKNKTLGGQDLINQIISMDCARFDLCSYEQIVSYWCSGQLSAAAKTECDALKSGAVCASSCSNAPAPSASSPSGSSGGIACNTKLEPSVLGINSPTVCDRLHDYVLVAPISKGGGTSTCASNNTCTKNSDCPENTSDLDHVVASGSNWCYGFKDGARCLQLRYTGLPQEPGCAAGEGSGGPNGCTNLDACSKCILTTKTDILPFYQSNGWDTQCSNMQAIVENWCGPTVDPSGCQSLKTGACSSACSAGGTTPPATGNPTISPNVFTTDFRLAENPTDLAAAAWQTYTSHPMTGINFEFKDKTPGKKFVWVEFKDSSGKTERRSAEITLLGSGPEITGCSLSFEGNTTTLNLTGKNFGTDRGKVKSGTQEFQVGQWKDTNIQAIWPNAPEGKTLDVTVTNAFGQAGPGQCSAVAQLALGAKVFCRRPSDHATENVQMVLAGAFDGGTLTRQKVTIDKDGLVQGLNQKLEEGKEYKISLKAPLGLRKAALFTASSGTTNLPNFVLPIGDIFPIDGGDEKINSLDKSELNRQWIIAQPVTNRTGDFNRDTRVNSIDWACMRYDFNVPSDPEPKVGVPSPSASSSASTN